MSDEEELADLFGTDSEDEPKVPDAPKPPKPAKQLEGAEDTQLQRVTPPPRAGSSDGEEGSEDEEGGRRRKPVPAGPPIDISVPLLPIPPKESLHLLRLTNIVGIEPRPFDAETFTSEEQTYIDEKGNQRVVLRDTNVIRWRVRRDGSGQEVMESNARFVRWPDGTQQLLLGDEVLDVAQQDISSNHFYLASAHKVCQLQAHLSSRLALKPPGLHSKLHKRLAAVVDQRNVKTNKVGMHAALTDPEREKQQMEDMARDREQLERQQGRRLARFAAARGAQQQQQRRLTSNFLEEDDDAYGEEADEDGDGLTATERARSALRRNRFDDAEEAEAAQRLQQAKRAEPATTAAAAAATAAGPSGARGRRRRGRALSDDDDEEEEEDDEEEEKDEEEADDDEFAALPEDEEEFEDSEDASDDDDDDSDSEEEDEDEDAAKGGADGEPSGAGGKRTAADGGEAPRPAKRAREPSAEAAEPEPARKPRRGLVLASDDEDA